MMIIIYFVFFSRQKCFVDINSLKYTLQTIIFKVDRQHLMTTCFRSSVPLLRSEVTKPSTSLAKKPSRKWHQKLHAKQIPKYHHHPRLLWRTQMFPAPSKQNNRLNLRKSQNPWRINEIASLIRGVNQITVI